MGKIDKPKNSLSEEWRWGQPPSKHKNTRVKVQNDICMYTHTHTHINKQVSPILICYPCIVSHSLRSLTNNITKGSLDSNYTSLLLLLLLLLLTITTTL